MQRRPDFQPRDAGFTLIEVVVAIALLGISYVAILGAMSGSLKLARKAAEHQNAVLLARSKMSEAMLGSGLEIIEPENEEKYSGVTYAYKIEYRDVPFVEPPLAEKLKLPVKLEEIAVEVYWGPPGKENRFRLTSLKLSPVAASPASDSKAALR